MFGIQKQTQFYLDAHKKLREANIRLKYPENIANLILWYVRMDDFAESGVMRRARLSTTSIGRKYFEQRIKELNPHFKNKNNGK